jgi:CheY-like chemotaxis protein
MSDRVYCPSCGEEVEPFVVIEKGDEIIKCSACGLNLSDVLETRITLSKVLLAEDSKLLREMAQEIFIKKGLTEDIQVFEDGEALIESYIRALTNYDATALIVLDIRMPNVGGFETGLAVRDIEKDFSVSKPTPILFFSAVKADDDVRKLLNKLSPAAYVYKGHESRPDVLAERLYKVILKLFQSKK